MTWGEGPRLMAPGEERRRRERKALEGQNWSGGHFSGQPALRLWGPGPLLGQGLRAEFGSSCLDVRKTASDTLPPGGWQNREGGRDREEFGERPQYAIIYAHSIGKNQEV